MNDTLKVLLGVFIGLTVLSGGILLYQNMPEQISVGSFAVEPDYLGGTTKYATSTKTFAEAGAASSTIIANCDGADMLDFNLMVAASSTATVVNWEYSFSYDGIDYFYEDGKTVASIATITHNPSHVVHSWTPGTTEEQTKNVTVTPIASKYCKVEIGTTGANANLWAEFLSRKTY